MFTPLFLYHMTAFLLLAMGIIGLLRRKTLVGMLISIELMLNGAGLSIAASAILTEGNAVLGQLTTLLVMGLAAAEATLLLAIMLVVFRRMKTTSVEELNLLQE